MTLLCGAVVFPPPESTSTQSRDYNFHEPCRGAGAIARININPVEGLQRYNGSRCPLGYKARININPVEGLQLDLQLADQYPIIARININPVEGLQQRAGKRGAGHLGQNQHQPSRGITTMVRGAKFQALGQPESTSTQSRDYNNTAWITKLTCALPESTSTQSRDYNLNTSSDSSKRMSGQNQHQPSRGITTAKSATATLPTGRARININPVEGLQLKCPKW